MARSALLTAALFSFSAAVAIPAIADDAKEDNALKDMKGKNEEVTQKKDDTKKMMETMKMDSKMTSKMIDGWPDASKKVAKTTIESYGAPDEATASMLIWHDNGPWSMTIVHREPRQHHFPKPHEDVLQQFIYYKTPVDKFDDLAEYDGSVVVDRTGGMISARCDKEAMNFLALNLAHDVIEGDKSVDDAREFYGKTVKMVMKGEMSEYVKGFTFTPGTDATADPDTPLQAMRVAEKDER